ncbi:predicted protein [Uncinocarpus reesii 1704]|uniref:Uncharacterized protein n=1 Tax=Uncinocarpus reesii (strain UAMH 1704) TaxID=336963 RepID=C4JS96_UNCRE|nr:uncharacterized protein UREG_05335 [Uncinocarpus reesii 1704]EEP80493.1 predicted protein [Uncinocarpus reesii 1704]
MGRNFSVLELGELTGEEGVVVVRHVDGDGDGDGDGGENEQRGEEAKPVDSLEGIAMGVPAPGASLKVVDDGLKLASKKPVRMKNCQDWIIDVVAELVQREMLPTAANDIVQNAPKN